MSDTVAPKSFGDKLQSLPRTWLFLILLLAASVPLFVPIALPNAPSQSSEDFFANVMSLKAGDKVLVASDWTKSTRGESGGECEALLRMLIRKKIKIAMYSSGDPQAPQVFRDTIGEIAKDELDHGEAPYQQFQDYVVCGYFPNAEGTALGINNNLRGVFAGKKDSPPNGSPQDIFNSPVFQGVNSVSDFKYLIMITASNTERVTFERVKKTPLMFMVTGVMTPEDNVYYLSGQLKGLIGGVKGVFDLEQMMEKGLNVPGGVSAPRFGPVPGFPGKHNVGRGTSYYFALHACLALLILAIFAGNLGVWLSRRGARS
ncbi:MAG TPA: hypothetical protein VG944_07055 [Fimbriimonas sp.]|nr:hypothetical protein [Fimbriimonas sp.]